MAGPVTYRATETVYVDDRYIRAGETFTTEAVKGEAWEVVEVEGKKGKAAPAPTPAADD